MPIYKGKRNLPRCILCSNELVYQFAPSQDCNDVLNETLLLFANEYTGVTIGLCHPGCIMARHEAREIGRGSASAEANGVLCRAEALPITSASEDQQKIIPSSFHQVTSNGNNDLPVADIPGKIYEQSSQSRSDLGSLAIGGTSVGDYTSQSSFADDFIKRLGKIIDIILLSEESSPIQAKRVDWIRVLSLLTQLGPLTMPSTGSVLEIYLSGGDMLSPVSQNSFSCEEMKLTIGITKGLRPICLNLPEQLDLEGELERGDDLPGTKSRTSAKDVAYAKREHWKAHKAKIIMSCLSKVKTTIDSCTDLGQSFKAPSLALNAAVEAFAGVMNLTKRGVIILSSILQIDGMHPTTQITFVSKVFNLPCHPVSRFLVTAMLMESGIPAEYLESDLHPNYDILEVVASMGGSNVVAGFYAVFCKDSSLFQLETSSKVFKYMVFGNSDKSVTKAFVIDHLKSHFVVEKDAVVASFMAEFIAIKQAQSINK